MRSAVVLAGGHSTRFGQQDEALAELDGDPLIRQVVDNVSEGVDEVVVNCRDEQRAAIDEAVGGHDVRYAIDPVPDGGPVAGIRTGCRVARGAWTVVAACDTPFVEPSLVETLFEQCRGDGAVPRIAGRCRPLMAVYDTDAAIEACETTLGTGSRAATDFLDRLSPAVVSEPAPPETVADIDTRATLQSLCSRST
ncbi:molybdenum cofactor guanylyltransferase [Haloarcula sp. GH36]|uniref:molybdenum cofactor guanylyltransferase n=1 Tax=Haloarcula montana TaxID=3111776 RepID=UPI002D77B22C|nr:molybdenum cofactor guanylyltransferase [Haloarcula sp. GH36]